MKEAYMSKLENQLAEWEARIGALTEKEKLEMKDRLDQWLSKKHLFIGKLDELRAADRWDALKMGVESAWDELRAAFETATSHMNAAPTANDTTDKTTKAA